MIPSQPSGEGERTDGPDQAPAERGALDPGDGAGRKGALLEVDLHLAIAGAARVADQEDRGEVGAGRHEHRADEQGERRQPGREGVAGAARAGAIACSARGGAAKQP